MYRVMILNFNLLYFVQKNWIWKNTSVNMFLVLLEGLKSSQYTKFWICIDLQIQALLILLSISVMSKKKSDINMTTFTFLC